MTLTVIRTLEREYPRVARNVVSRLSEEDRELLESMSALRWMPFGPHMDIVDAAREELGSQRNIVFWHEATCSVVQRPLLHSFIRMAVRLSGSTATGLLTRVPFVFNHLFQGIGECTAEAVEDGPGLAVVEVRGFPAHNYSFDSFSEGFIGSLQAAGTLVGSPVRIQVEHSAGGYFRMRAFRV